jgi:AraC-like DNA-binding protein
MVISSGFTGERPLAYDLKGAVRSFARKHANSDGMAMTPVPGLRMMCAEAPSGPMQSTYKPLVCLILQGAKHMTVGAESRIFRQHQSVIVSADMPVTGRIVEATRAHPYLAIAIELDMAILRDIAVQMRATERGSAGGLKSLYFEDTSEAVLQCATRLMRLIELPQALPVLHPAIMRELHYWLLAGKHGMALRALAVPESHASRLAAAIAILRAEFRSRISMQRLAHAAAMSLTAFHKHFKTLTSLTPGQYQKRLRLVEARRLMLDEGFLASRTAFEVGYESVSQFTREYRRMFGAPPRRDSQRFRQAPQTVRMRA